MAKNNLIKEILSNKALSRLVGTSILGMIVCIICLCSTSYAWFTGNVSNTQNALQVSDGTALSVTVSCEGVELAGIDGGVELEAGKTYTLTLSLPADTASGYCLITTSGGSYYTEYIMRHNESLAQTVSYTVTVAETQTVTFTTRWGTHSKTLASTNGEIAIP